MLEEGAALQWNQRRVWGLEKVADQMFAEMCLIGTTRAFMTRTEGRELRKTGILESRKWSLLEINPHAGLAFCGGDSPLVPNRSLRQVFCQP